MNPASDSSEAPSRKRQAASLALLGSVERRSARWLPPQGHHGVVILGGTGGVIWRKEGIHVVFPFRSPGSFQWLLLVDILSYGSGDGGLVHGSPAGKRRSWASNPPCISLPQGCRDPWL